MTAPNPVWTPLLLADPSPCLRRLVLIELLSQAQPACRENRPHVPGTLEDAWHVGTIFTTGYHQPADPRNRGRSPRGAVR